jgi:hypothetical protein
MPDFLSSPPHPFEEALQWAADRGLLPTNLSTAQIRNPASVRSTPFFPPEGLFTPERRAQLAAEIRDQSVFSARLQQMKILQKIKDLTDNMVSGKINLATARADLRQLVIDCGYTPENGFPGENVEPVEPGELKDFSSFKRTNLILTTQYRLAMNRGLQIAGNEPERLWQFPCYELLRIYTRQIPRGYRRGPKDAIIPVPDDDWPSRFEACGGELVDGDRMIAPKGDPIWEALGDSSTFDDALDTSCPPFAFNSGFGWQERDRAECIELGVIDDDEGGKAMPVDLLEGLKADAKQFDPELLKAFREEMKQEGDYLVPLRSSLSRAMEDAREAYKTGRRDFSNAAQIRNRLTRFVTLCNSTDRSRRIRGNIQSIIDAVEVLS